MTTNVVSFEGSLGCKLAEVARLHRNHAAALLEEIGLHPGQERLLKVLQVQDGCTMGELAEALGLRFPTVTKMVTRLAFRGFVIRREVPDDRRKARVLLTPRGRRAGSKIDSLWQVLEDHAFSGLTSGERTGFADALSRICESLAPEDGESAARQILEGGE